MKEKKQEMGKMKMKKKKIFCENKEKYSHNKRRENNRSELTKEKV